MSATEITLRCFECGKSCSETWDDHCEECHYVLSGGDQGHPEDFWKYMRAEGANVQVSLR